jgi:hypothetical protein
VYVLCYTKCDMPNYRQRTGVKQQLILLATDVFAFHISKNEITTVWRDRNKEQKLFLGYRRVHSSDTINVATVDGYMYVCICMYVCVCMYVCMYVRTYVTLMREISTPHQILFG